MIETIASMVSGIFGLGGKLIEDKDKKAEYAFKVLGMTHEISMKVLDMKTYPWIDGLVKLAYAGDQIIKGLIRPLGSLALFIYGLTHLEVMQSMIDMGVFGQAGVTGVFGTFPAWLASRHAEKARKNKES